jgi:uncharacterized membrane protein YccC
MPSEGRDALRIALALSGAFTAASALDLQLSFLAPLVAGVVSAGSAPKLIQLVALPVLAWLSVFGSGFLLQAFHGMPLTLCALLFAVFAGGFRLCAHAKTASVGLIILVLFSVIPDVLIRAPELAEDVARWCGSNFAVAAASVFLAGIVLPRRAPDPVLPPLRESPLPPPVAAAALLVAAILTIAFQLPAPGAVLVSVVVALRPDAIASEQVIRDRFIAAIVGGAAALLAWEAIWLAPGLPVLAAVTLLLAWLIALRIVAMGADRSAAMKSLNALAILLGEGLSLLYEDTDERLWTRLGGVILGITYAAVVLSLFRRRSPVTTGLVNLR